MKLSNFQLSFDIDGQPSNPTTPPADTDVQVTFDGSLWTLGPGTGQGGLDVMRNGVFQEGRGIKFKKDGINLKLLNNLGNWYLWKNPGWEQTTAPDAESEITGDPGNFTVNLDLTPQQSLQIVPASSPWRTRIDNLPTHPRSAEIIASIPVFYVPTGHRFKPDFGGPGEGIPYSVGSGNPPVPVQSAYEAESDPGPHPIARGSRIESGSDKHLIYIDLNTFTRYEMFLARRYTDGFKCDSCAVFPPGNDDSRTLGFTSADAAGLSIFAGLIRFDEMQYALAQTDPTKRHLGHAIRMTIPVTGKGFIYPARHYTTNGGPYGLPGRLPMGTRMRIKSSIDPMRFPAATEIIVRTIQLFGTIVADNGGAFLIQGTEDERWGVSGIFDQLTSSGGLKTWSGPDFVNSIEIVDFADIDVVQQ